MLETPLRRFSQCRRVRRLLFMLLGSPLEQFLWCWRFFQGCWRLPHCSRDNFVGIFSVLKTSWKRFSCLQRFFFGSHFHCVGHSFWLILTAGEYHYRHFITQELYGSNFTVSNTQFEQFSQLQTPLKRFSWGL